MFAVGSRRFGLEFQVMGVTLRAEGPAAEPGRSHWGNLGLDIFRAVKGIPMSQALRQVEAMIAERFS